MSVVKYSIVSTRRANARVSYKPHTSLHVGVVLKRPVLNESEIYRRLKERERETRRDRGKISREIKRERVRKREGNMTRESEIKREISRFIKIKNIKKQNLLYGCFKNDPHKR